jgi:hypothetical protein
MIYSGLLTYISKIEILGFLHIEITDFGFTKMSYIHGSDDVPIGPVAGGFFCLGLLTWLAWQVIPFLPDFFFGWFGVVLLSLVVYGYDRLDKHAHRARGEGGRLNGWARMPFEPFHTGNPYTSTTENAW